MKTLFWIPSIIADTLTLLLPRSLFVALYKPASEGRREAEINLRNAERLAGYYARKAMRND